MTSPINWFEISLIMFKQGLDPVTTFTKKARVMSRMVPCLTPNLKEAKTGTGFKSALYGTPSKDDSHKTPAVK